MYMCIFSCTAQRILPSKRLFSDVNKNSDASSLYQFFTSLNWILTPLSPSSLTPGVVPEPQSKVPQEAAAIPEGTHPPSDCALTPSLRPNHLIPISNIPSPETFSLLLTLSLLLWTENIPTFHPFSPPSPLSPPPLPLPLSTPHKLHLHLPHCPTFQHTHVHSTTKISLT